MPPRDVLLKRFHLVNRVYGAIIDEKTKKPLFRPEAVEAIKKLRVHLASNCVSDPRNIPLYFDDGKDSMTGQRRFRCVRGTNDLEGYHHHNRGIMAWCSSPVLAHCQMLEHSYRWNLRQDIRNRGLDPAMGGFYDQPVLEAIQVHAAKRSTRLCCRLSKCVQS